MTGYSLSSDGVLHFGNRALVQLSALQAEILQAIMDARPERLTCGDLYDRTAAASPASARVTVAGLRRQLAGTGLGIEKVGTGHELTIGPVDPDLAYSPAGRLVKEAAMPPTTAARIMARPPQHVAARLDQLTEDERRFVEWPS